MKRSAAFVVLITLSAAAGAQVFRAEPERPQRSSSSTGALNTPAPAQKPPFAAPPARTAKEESCANLRRESRALARRSREAKSTGERDQFDLQYQRLQESRSRAGC
jgi:hypothetical protein